MIYGVGWWRKVARGSGASRRRRERRWGLKTPRLPLLSWLEMDSKKGGFGWWFVGVLMVVVALDGGGVWPRDGGGVGS